MLGTFLVTQQSGFGSFTSSCGPEQEKRRIVREQKAQAFLNRLGETRPLHLHKNA